MKKQAGPWSRLGCLLAQTEFRDQIAVALNILVPQIVQKLSPLADQLQKACAGMEILLMTLEMVGQIVDPRKQENHLNFRESRVRFGLSIFLDEFSLAFRG